MAAGPTAHTLAVQYVRDRTARREFTGRTPETVRAVLGHFNRHVGADTPATRIARRDIESWLSSRPLAATTIRNHLSIVRHWFDWMVVGGVLKKSPCLGVKGPRMPRFLPRGLDAEAVGRLLAVTPDHRGQLIILLMCQEGLRCAEVAGLELADLDTNDRVILVRGKGGHERVLPLSDETWTVMGRYLADHPASAGPLIRSYSRPKGLSPGYISDRVNLWMRHARVKMFARDGKSAHSLRHTAATDMLRAGAHLRDVQNVLGHQSLQTTQRYLPWVVRDLREAMGGRSYRWGGAAERVGQA